MTTVLIVDDSLQLQQHVSRTLVRSRLADRILTANNGVQALQVFGSEKVDLVLCDLVMPGLDGFKVLSILRERVTAVPVPVILLTARGEVSEKVRCLEAGGSDYLTKPFDEAELVARCRVHLELKKRTEQLQALASTDYLTGVANRLRLREDLMRDLERAGRSGSPVGFVIADLDHFKTVNDTCGHLAGDELLVAVATALKKEVRVCDLVARYGGEEFALLLPDATTEGVRAAAERCRRRIEALPPPRAGVNFAVSASFGGVSVSRAGAALAEKVILAADAALYLAKGGGRNRVVMAEDFSTTSPEVLRARAAARSEVGDNPPARASNE